MILSYYGFRSEVVMLMHRLSKITRNFINKNKLEGFLVKGLLPREISAVVNLYHKNSRGTYFRYPDDETFAQMKRFELKHQRRITLRKILANYTDSKIHLRRIQLLFFYDFESPSFGFIDDCTYGCPIFSNTEMLANEKSIRSLEVNFA